MASLRRPCFWASMPVCMRCVTSGERVCHPIRSDKMSLDILVLSLAALRLDNTQELVGGDAADLLAGARWPQNLHRRASCGAESKMNALVAGGEIASPGGGVLRLSIHQEAGPEPIPVAACAAKGDGKPVPAPLPAAKSAIAEKQRTAAENGHHYVHPAIIVEVAESGSAASHWRIGSARDAFEAAAMIHREHGKLQRME